MGIDTGAALREEISSQRAHWRLLRGWKITLSFDGYCDSCTIHPTKKQACIRPWSGAVSELAQYVHHELLHICLRSLYRLRGKYRHAAEEIMVQDLCAVKITRLTVIRKVS